MGFPYMCNIGADETMGLTKKGINATARIREGGARGPRNELDPSELGYVVLIQVLLFLISLGLMLRS
jgi:hypothetical protein